MITHGKLCRREEEVGGGTTQLRTAEQGQDPVVKGKTMPGEGSACGTT